MAGYRDERALENKEGGILNMIRLYFIKCSEKQEKILFINKNPAQFLDKHKKEL